MALSENLVLLSACVVWYQAILRMVSTAVNDANVTRMMYAAEAVHMGVLPYAAMKDNMLKYENSAGANRALQMLGNYVQQVKDQRNVDEFMVLLSGEEQSGEAKWSLPEEQKKPEFEYMKPFAEQLKDFKETASNPEKREELFGRGDLVISGTPKLWKDLKLPSLPVSINQQHVSYAMGLQQYKKGKYIIDHVFAQGEFEKLPDKLADPVAIIYDHQNQQQAITVMVDMISQSGKNVLVPIEISVRRRIGKQYFDTQPATTVHGDTDYVGMLKSAIKNDTNDDIKLFYINKEKAQKVLLNGSQGAAIEVPSGIRHRITDTGSPVKLNIEHQTESRQFKNWFGKSVVTENGKAGGTAVQLYHQTDADITVFDTKHKGAGTSDSSTPHGVFMKPAPNDIGLKGKKQMALYARIENPITFSNRAEAEAWYVKHIDGYEASKAAEKQVDAEYQKRYDALDQEGDEWYKAHWQEVRAGKISAEEVERQLRKSDMDKLFEEWHEAGNAATEKTKALLDNYFAKSEYDGMHLIEDAGSFGRKIETWIAFESTQVKSATDNRGTFDPENPNIRYSLPEADRQRDAEYMRAVESGDEEKQAKLVKEAAEAAGYDTPKLYHGSPAFGFTEIDLGKGEGLIFATSDRRVAETYSGKTERTRISERSNAQLSWEL